VTLKQVVSILILTVAGCGDPADQPPPNPRNVLSLYARPDSLRSLPGVVNVTAPRTMPNPTNRIVHLLNWHAVTSERCVDFSDLPPYRGRSPVLRFEAGGWVSRWFGSGAPSAGATPQADGAPISRALRSKAMQNLRLHGGGIVECLGCGAVFIRDSAAGRVERDRRVCPACGERLDGVNSQRPSRLATEAETIRIALR